MIRSIAVALFLTVFVAAAPEARAQEDASAVAAGADVTVVKMVEKSATQYAFIPAVVAVESGQVIRFVQEGQVPHNVEFKKGPSVGKLDGIRMGPFLMARGEAYEIRIDDRFSRGTYDYVCTPHEAMGMTGKIVVERRGESRK